VNPLGVLSNSETKYQKGLKMKFNNIDATLDDILFESVEGTTWNSVKNSIDTVRTGVFDFVYLTIWNSVQFKYQISQRIENETE
jgi:hypothetical protein